MELNVIIAYLFYLMVLISIFQNHRIGAANVTLAGGSHVFEGRVEVIQEREWGTVCDDLWTLSDAQVVCRELGYYGADQALVAAAFGQGNGPIWLDDVQCVGDEETIYDCGYSLNHNQSCSGHQDDASVICTTQGTLGLVRGSQPNNGNLVILANSTGHTLMWTSVVEDTWNDKSGMVACRQLGYASFLSWSLVDSSDVPVADTRLRGFDCQGHERRLEDCPHASWDMNSWPPEYDIYLLCDPTVTRVVDGSGPSEGRVEIFYGGAWGTVCDELWEMDDADVVCHELGFPLGALDAPGHSYFGSASGPILLGNVQCSGRETSIFECEHDGIARGDCNHDADAGVVCRTNVRLAGGSHPFEGRVEVIYKQEWGTVCDDTWTLSDAHVVCRELGYFGADHALVAAAFGQGNGSIWLDDVQCEGNEETIYDCDSQTIGFHNCGGHQDDASVICTTRGTLRLVGGSQTNEGKLEILESLTDQWAWGSVCENSWNNESGIVACRQLGYAGYLSSNLALDDGSYYHGDISLQDFDCQGDERRLEDCQNAIWEGNDTCPHEHYIFLRCDATVTRVVDGSEASEGRVEVFYGGTWGTVCDDYWEINDAHVVCRELGYSLGALEAPRNSQFGSASGAILLDNVQCFGWEASIFDCNHNGIANENCNHQTEAGVICLRHEKQMQLLSGNNSHSGVVNIYLDAWGILCDSNWGNGEAMVACRQLGYSEGASIKSVYINSVTGITAIRNYMCNGDESLLNDCQYSNNGIACPPEHVVQISCDSPTKELDIKLVNGRASDQGRIEIFHDGQWSTMANIQSNEAEVVCRQLGYERLIDIYEDAFFGEGYFYGPVLGDGVITCTGDEEKLSDCFVIEDFENTGDHSNDVAVLCKPFDSIGSYEFRLVPEDGSTLWTRGRLEVLHDGVWGTVCSPEGFGNAEAINVCNYLGYQGGPYAVLARSEFTVGTGQIWLESFSCEYGDSTLGDCHHSAWGYGIGCVHAQDVGLDCFHNPTDPPSTGIPVWEIILITLLALLVVVVLLAMAALKEVRQRSRANNRSFRTNNLPSEDTMGVSYHHNAVHILDNPSFQPPPPPEYRPPTPPPAEAPPSYDSVVKKDTTS